GLFRSLRNERLDRFGEERAQEQAQEQAEIDGRERGDLLSAHQDIAGDNEGADREHNDQREDPVEERVVAMKEMRISQNGHANDQREEKAAKNPHEHGRGLRMKLPRVEDQRRDDS